MKLTFSGTRTVSIPMASIAMECIPKFPVTRHSPSAHGRNIGLLIAFQAAFGYCKHPNRTNYKEQFPPEQSESEILYNRPTILQVFQRKYFRDVTERQGSRPTYWTRVLIVGEF